MARYFFHHALLPNGWIRDVVIEVTADGMIGSVQPGARDGADEGFAIGLPGLVNAHSHAFQRAMAGLAEVRGSQKDSFWTWRETMYRFAMAVTPEDQRAISAHLQLELLKHGVTALVEFHYLHNHPDGRAYDEPARLSLATVEAARETGIGLTHMPVLYMTSGFDGAPLAARQKRFGLDVDTLMRIAERIRDEVAGEPDMSVGLGAHSLRAVPAEALRDLLAARGALGIEPFHIHVAEQLEEVEDCRRHHSLPPAQWLLENAAIDESWTLVHATHVTATERAGLARSGAAVALCPTTEANLGDGIFPLAEFVDDCGRIALGTDSHVCVSPWEEMRWLEYVQRLKRLERNVMTSPDGDGTGTALIRHLSESAAHVTGRPVGRLEGGYRADLIILDESQPQFAGRSPQKIVDTAIFASSNTPVRHVLVGGRWCIRDGRHEREAEIAGRYSDLLRRFGEGNRMP